MFEDDLFASIDDGFDLAFAHLEFFGEWFEAYAVYLTAFHDGAVTL